MHPEDFQIVLVDTPGLHRPRTLLWPKRLDDLGARHLLRRRRDRPVHTRRRGDRPGDRWIFEQIRDVAPRTALVVIDVTKIDKVPKDRVAAQLMAVHELAGEHAAAIVPVSAPKGEQIGGLLGVLVEHLPPETAYYPDGNSPTNPKRR